MNQTDICCNKAPRYTPLAIANRPGLSTLSYRVGTHSSFLSTMLARLSTMYLPVRPPAGAYLLRPDDFLDGSWLWQRLQARADALSNFLYGHLNTTLREHLERSEETGALPEGLKLALIEALNNCLNYKTLEAIDGIHVPELAKQHEPALPLSANLIRTNRLILEAAYPKAIVPCERSYPLRGLLTRESGDPSIALLDAWAVVGDVLTFYQERIANEGYLRSATERRSIQELARLVGYQLRPGVAASTYLAYTLEGGARTTIPAGARAQSVPGPNELPQPFETMEALEARADWNNLRPRASLPQYLTHEMILGGKPLYLKGMATRLRPGDPLLFDQGASQEVYRVHAVETLPLLDRTLVMLQRWLPEHSATAEHAVQDIVARYRVLGTPITAENQTARSAAVVLDRLQHTGILRLGEVVDQVVPELRALHASVKDGSYLSLAAALGQLIDELSAAQKRSSSVEISDGMDKAVEAVKGHYLAANRPLSLTQSKIADEIVKHIHALIDSDATKLPETLGRLRTNNYILEGEQKAIADALTGIRADLNSVQAEPKLVEAVMSNISRIILNYTTSDECDDQVISLLKRVSQAQSDQLSSLIEAIPDLQKRYDELLGDSSTTHQAQALERLLQSFMPIFMTKDITRSYIGIGKPLELATNTNARKIAEHLKNLTSAKVGTSLAEIHASYDALKAAQHPILEPVVARLLDDLTEIRDRFVISYSASKRALSEGRGFNTLFAPPQPTTVATNPISKAAAPTIRINDKQAKLLRDNVSLTLRKQASLLTLLGKEDTGTKPGLQTRFDIPQVFGRLSGTTVQFLTAMSHPFQQTLYPALGGQRAGGMPEPRAVMALRTRAAVFGHNAPLKAIPDKQGVVISRTEWPLAEEVQQAFTVRLSLQEDSVPVGVEKLLTSKPGPAGVVAECKLVVGENQAEVVRLLAGNAPILLGESQLTIETTINQSGVLNTCTFALETNNAIVAKIDLKWVSNTLKVIVNDGPVVTVLTGKQTISYTSGDRTVLVVAGQDLFISVEEVAALDATTQHTLTLDAVYDQVVPGGWVLIDRGDAPEVFQVREVHTVTRAAYGIQARATQLLLDRPWLKESDLLLSALRSLAVYVQSESLALAEEPVEDDVSGDSIEVDGLYEGLQPGRWLVVAGERSDVPSASSIMAAELVMLGGTIQRPHQIDIGDLPGDTPHTTLELTGQLAHSYRRDTVTVYANVVRATHGETRSEILGSGDGSKALQSFRLRQSPLTYLASATPTGATSTLEVRVNGVRWHEADSLVGLSPKEHAYVSQISDDTTTITFGTGHEGGRLPSGVENVSALYRTGIGRAGNVRAGQIMQALTRPLGVQSVTNPLPASGGAEREQGDDARQNAPLYVRTLDRIVSVQDYADFARAFAGIGKASAQRLSDRCHQLVHLTIAGADDIPIDPTSDLYLNLGRALRHHGTINQPLRINTRDLKLLVIQASVRLHPDFLWELVEPKIRTALLDTFSFARRDLGQDALLSEVMQAIQAVDGVVYVDVDTFAGIDGSALRGAASASDLPIQIADTIAEAVNNSRIHGPNRRVAARLARRTAEGISPAQLVMLSPLVRNALILKELSI